MFHHRVGVLEALVQALINLDERTLEKLLLVGEFLLDGGLLDEELLDLLQQKLHVGVHCFTLHGSAGVVESDRGLWWWWQW